MRDISTYPVSFPFGATTAPYSPTHPHSGEDRAAPKGTPIVVSGTELGVVGETGQATGYHLHIQKAVNGKFVNPNGQGLGIAGTVSEVGYNSEIGNYVRIVDNDGVRWSYFHMDKPAFVKVGQVIGEDMETFKDSNDVRVNGFGLFGIDIAGSDPALLAWVGKSKLDFFKGLGPQVVNNTNALNKRIAELEQNGDFMPVGTLYTKK